MSYIGNGIESYWVFDGVLDKSTCNKIIKIGKARKKEKGTVGKKGSAKDLSTHLDIRDSNVTFLKNQDFILNILRHFISVANKNAQWNFDLNYHEAIQFTEYKKNQFYTWHQDSWPHPDEENNNRKLSAIIQLSDPKDYIGGDIEFYVPNPTLKFDECILSTSQYKKRGTVIVFPSYFFHRVKPVTKGTRYSLVNWVKGPVFK